MQGESKKAKNTLPGTACLGHPWKVPCTFRFGLGHLVKVIKKMHHRCVEASLLADPRSSQEDSQD